LPATPFFKEGEFASVVWSRLLEEGEFAPAVRLVTPFEKREFVLVGFFRDLVILGCFLCEGFKNVLIVNKKCRSIDK
jgi:hypothetical protein